LALVGEARVASDDEEAAVLRQVGDDVLGDAVEEVLLLGIARHVLKREHRDRGLLGRRENGLTVRYRPGHGARGAGGLSVGGGGRPAPDPDRAGGVFEGVLPGLTPARREGGARGAAS